MNEYCRPNLGIWGSRLPRFTRNKRGDNVTSTNDLIPTFLLSGRGCSVYFVKNTPSEIPKEHFNV
jgi:hypothetical protein